MNRLLDSRHYGEHWGRFWLDVARYAEDQAHTFAVRPNNSGYRYRDWVIEAFNSDLPYDEFVKLQIAGDLIGPSVEGNYDHLIALGFFNSELSITETVIKPRRWLTNSMIEWIP